MKKVPDTNGGGEFKPSAFIKEEGAMIEGVLIARRLVNTMYGERPVYTMKLQDYNCKFSKGETFVEPKENEEVEFFASTRLERQLAKAGLNKLVRISYAGQKKVGKGNPAHIYDVLVGE